MKKAVGLACAIVILVGMACGAYALSEGDSLITLSYLTQIFVPDAVEQGTKKGTEMLQESYNSAIDSLDQVQSELMEQATGGEGLYSADLHLRECSEGDRFILPTGCGFILYNGTVGVEYSGAVVNVNTGEEVASGSLLQSNHRYLIAENTAASFIVLSGAAQIGIQGGYTTEKSEYAATPFFDVAQTDWYYAPVGYVYQEGLFSGMDERHFAPSAAMNRAMLMTVLYKMAGAPEKEMQAAVISFDDVAENSWYAPYVKWGAQQGITAGTGPTTFSPERQITREQVVALLYSFATKYLGMELRDRADLSGYEDLEQASSWALDSLAWAVDAGILSSSSVDRLTLSPQKNANRAEVATMLRAFSEKIL